MSGEKVEPDGRLPRSMVGYGHDSDAFLRSTILRVLDEEIAKWEEIASGCFADSMIVKAHQHLHALRSIRSRFTKGDDHAA